MATRLFVGNLPENTEETDLRTVFSNYGEITNLDLKSKSAVTNESKKFAFVTISGSNYNIESCIKYFTNEDFNGNRLYVTRARESFLERLQRERLEAHKKETEKAEGQELPKKSPVIKLSGKLNPRKRKIDDETSTNNRSLDYIKTFKNKNVMHNGDGFDVYRTNNVSEIFKKKRDPNIEEKSNPKKNIQNYTSTNDKALHHTKAFENTNVMQNADGIIDKRTGNILEMYKKQDSDMKRMEAMKKKRIEFKEKKMIVKTGLTGVDKVPNNKIIFSDNEEDTPKATSLDKNISKTDKKNMLFDDDDKNDSGDELNFEIKKQFEGEKGQKVLDLQSRYKSDKRFVLDERFIEDEEEEGKDKEIVEEDEQIEVNQTDERDKQINILQDVLGFVIRKRNPEDERDGKKNKPKIGMLRFDPSQPEHAKFLAPVDNSKQDFSKKSKRKTKDKQVEETEVQEQKQEEPRPEVSKEQFYKVSEALKEAIVQPTSFSLRSLFGNAEIAKEESKQEEANYVPLEAPKKSKVKNPLEPGEKNPFVYDSSDSETEEVGKEAKTEITPTVTESKAVWKESFFFGNSDHRFEEGLAFFKGNQTEAQKERRELKSLMKKRIYNKERKDQMQMFQKKIGGRKKTMKKTYRKKS